MNGYIRIALLFIINFICFKLVGFWFGIISSFIVIYRILTLIGITRTPIIYRGFFIDGISYTKDYLGPYSKHQEAFMEAGKLIETYKLKNFVVIALYYDSPSTIEESKLRSSIGIYKKNIAKSEEIPEDFEKYCEQNGYNKNELPRADAIYSNWDYFNFISMMIGIQKFYKLINNKLKDEYFKKQYKVDEKKLKAFIEVYECHNNSMSFYVPITKGDNFMVFKKDK